jgi:hypothetical protein
METQKAYSCGLLNSVAPDDLSSLHLNDYGAKDNFDWAAYEKNENSFSQIIVNFLKTTASKWAQSSVASSSH